MFADLLAWGQEHRVLLQFGVIGSITISLVGLVVIPWIIVLLPPDYFQRNVPGPKREHFLLYLLYLLWRVLKNLLGGTLVAIGILLLFLPGQGLLTILIGAMLFDGPYKRKTLRWLILRPGVLQTLNWMRVQAKREPFIVPEQGGVKNSY